MKARILVAYVTKYGTTEEFAQRIAGAFRDAGHESECVEASHVESVEDFDLVILGSPIYYSRVMDGAVRFVEKHCSTLIRKHVALFAVGVTQNQKAGREFTEHALLTLAGKCQGVDPNIAMFRGRVQLSKMNFVYRSFLRFFSGFSDVDESRDQDFTRWVGELVAAFDVEDNSG